MPTNDSRNVPAGDMNDDSILQIEEANISDDLEVCDVDEIPLEPEACAVRDDIKREESAPGVEIPMETAQRLQASR